MIPPSSDPPPPCAALRGPSEGHQGVTTGSPAGGAVVAVAPEPGTLETWLVSTAHNRTQHPPTMPGLHGSPGLQVWAKASTVRVSIGKASWAKGPKDRPPALQASEPPVEGTLSDGAAPSVQGTTEGRGAVTGLSKGSRARLMQMLSTIDASAPAVFTTLTWPAWAAPDRDAWHTAWDRWRKRLCRSWPDAAGIWRREYTKAGTVHLHLLTFGIPIDRQTVRQLQSWTATAWADVVDAPEYDRRKRAGTSVEVPRVGAAVSKYIAKYASKTANGDGIERPMGRWWGTFGGRENIPFTLPDDYRLTEAEAHQLRRTMERWLQAKRRERERVTGRRVKGRPPRPRATRRIFTDDPGLWLRVLDGIRAPAPLQAPQRAV